MIEMQECAEDVTALLLAERIGRVPDADGAAMWNVNQARLLIATCMQSGI